MRHNQFLKITFQLHLVVLMLSLGFIWTRLPFALAQTPTPSPTPSGALSTPEPFGINGISHWGSDNQGRRRQTVPLSPGATETPTAKNYVAFAKQDIGADWDRWSVHWNMVEDYQGNFNFANASNQVAIEDGLKLASDENQVKVVLVLNGGIAGQYNNVVCAEENPINPGKCLRYRYIECDDANKPNTCYAVKGLSYEGSDLASNPWARFIKEVTSNPAIRNRVAAWEIINEDDLISYDVPPMPISAANPGGPPSNADLNPYARNFIQAIKVTCEVLAQTNPSGDILLGGIEHVEAYKLAKNTEDSKYRAVMDALRTDPKLACIDGISLHSYGNPKDSAFLIENRDVIWDPTGSEPWPSDKQIWITESGLQHATGIFSFNEARTGCDGTEYVCGTEVHQASYIIEHAVLTQKAFGASGISGKLFHYNYIDDYAPSNPPEPPLTGDDDRIWGLFNGTPG